MQIRCSSFTTHQRAPPDHSFTFKFVTDEASGAPLATVRQGRLHDTIPGFIGAVVIATDGRERYERAYPVAERTVQLYLHLTVEVEALAGHEWREVGGAVLVVRGKAGHIDGKDLLETLA